MQSPLRAFAVTLLLLGLMGCDPVVDTFQENELHYSIFGYLNASADTQFVRVELLRDSMLVRTPATLNADVVLTEQATGRTVPLQDSLFQYLDEATAHNYYTTFDIKPSTSYRLTVQGPDGAESRVQTRVPDTFPPPILSIPVDWPPRRCNGTTIVLIRGIDRLVAVRAIYHMIEPKGAPSFSHLPDTTQLQNGVIRARINYGRDWCKIAPRGTAMKVEVVVAAGDPDWPEFLSLDLETETLPEVASNVEGGVGLVGGIVTDTLVVYSR